MRPWSVHRRLDFDIHSTKMWSEYLQHETFGYDILFRFNNVYYGMTLMHIIGFITDKLYSTLYVY
jgi:hypothetical protein